MQVSQSGLMAVAVVSARLAEWWFNAVDAAAAA